MNNFYYERIGVAQCAIADVIRYGGTSYLITRINVPVLSRGEGYGRRLLAKIIEDADMGGWDLLLEVVPGGGDGDMGFKELAQWYWRNGFRWDDVRGGRKRGVMRRACLRA